MGNAPGSDMKKLRSPMHKDIMEQSGSGKKLMNIRNYLGP